MLALVLPGGGSPADSVGDRVAAVLSSDLSARGRAALAGASHQTENQRAPEAWILVGTDARSPAPPGAAISGARQGLKVALLQNRLAASPEEFNDQLKEKVVRAEPNLTLF